MAVLEKACIRPVLGDSPDIEVEFQFNPSKYSVNRSVQWKALEAKGADTPPLEFVNGGPRTLSMELFVDDYEGGGEGPVGHSKGLQKFVEQLEKLTQVDKNNAKGSDKARPPKVEFRWASGPKPFPAVIKSLNVTYTMFHPDGRPARAKVNLTLQETTHEPKKQPGSSGGAGVRSHRVLAGETLDIIAYQELGDSRHWPHIADINHLGNPLNIRPGQELLIKPLR